MIYTSETLEGNALMDVAQHMCASARTAPKTRGIDKVVTLVVTGDDILALADKMDEIDERLNGSDRTFFTRNANNLRSSGAVVMIGIKKYFYGLNCTDCGFDSCESCSEKNGTCVFSGIDLGIAIGSAVATAGDFHIDNRIMYSVGKAAQEMRYSSEDIIWFGIPLSVSGKNPYFNYKKK